MVRRTWLLSLALLPLVVGADAVVGAGAKAQDVTLKVHHFLPPQSAIPANFIEPWTQKVAEESGGRIAFEIYPAMQLGGKPPSLYDQARDGVVDIIWTLPGYTPGRFPKVEAFELPFVMTTAGETSMAFHSFYEEHIADQFDDVHIIAAHVHGRGVIHMKGDAVETLEDMQGRTLRGPTRMTNMLLEELGAVPIGMPVPAVPESLSKGVIDGTVIPWEVSAPLKVAELVDSHTEFSGDNGLYTATFIFAMNKAKYEGLPDDLKQVIDDNSGPETAKLMGDTMAEGDVKGREVAEASGNPIIVLDEAETQRWKEAAEPVVQSWVEEMEAQDIDGAALVEAAKTLIETHSKP